MKKRGFSLIEAAIVLGIVGLVIGGIWVAASTVRKQHGYATDKELIAYAHNVAQQLGKASFGNVYSLTPTFLKNIPGNFTWTGSGFRRGTTTIMFELRAVSGTAPAYFRIWYYPNYSGGPIGSDIGNCTEMVRFAMMQNLGIPPSGVYSISLYDYNGDPVGSWRTGMAKWDIGTTQSSCSDAQVVDIFWAV